MSFLDYFRARRDNNSAATAKERLQVIVAHERGRRNQPDYLPQMQQEILEVIRKYIPVEQDDVQVQVEESGNCSVLELKVTLPGCPPGQGGGPVPVTLEPRGSRYRDFGVAGPSVPMGSARLSGGTVNQAGPLAVM